MLNTHAIKLIFNVQNTILWYNKNVEKNLNKTYYTFSKEMFNTY